MGEPNHGLLPQLGNLVHVFEGIAAPEDYFGSRSIVLGPTRFFP